MKHLPTMWATKKTSMGGFRYKVSFTNDFCHKVWVYFLKQKYEVFMFRNAWVENQKDGIIKYLQLNN